MLREECRAFAKEYNNIGCNSDLQMVINLKGDVPVQRAYTSISKPLLREVKEYVQDLLVRGWIVKFKLSYAAPIVCVQKKKRWLPSSLHRIPATKSENSAGQKSASSKYVTYLIPWVDTPGSVSSIKARPNTKGLWLRAHVTLLRSPHPGVYMNGWGSRSVSPTHLWPFKEVGKRFSDRLFPKGFGQFIDL